MLGKLSPIYRDTEKMMKDGKNMIYRVNGLEEFRWPLGAQEHVFKNQKISFWYRSKFLISGQMIHQNEAI